MFITFYSINIFIFIYILQFYFIVFYKKKLIYNLKFFFLNIFLKFITNWSTLIIDFFDKGLDINKVFNLDIKDFYCKDKDFYFINKDFFYINKYFFFKQIYILLKYTILAILHCVYSIRYNFYNKWYYYALNNVFDFINDFFFKVVVGRHIFSYYKFSIENYYFYKVFYKAHYNIKLKASVFWYLNKRGYFDRKVIRENVFEYYITNLVFNNSYLKNFFFLYLNINYLYNFFKKLFISLIVVITILLYLLYFFNLNLIRQLSIWFVVGMIFFWLISGFNFFLKRYKFGKFTSVIIRFWKRANIYFWLVEGFLFSIFFYYYLNSSQEPLYAYDTAALQQDYLVNIVVFYFNLFILIFIIIYFYFLILNATQFINSQNLQHILFITILLIYIYIIESYQFYYTITVFFENIWEYNYDNLLWTVEVESPRIRVKHQYNVLILLAKYWHFVFIFIMWIFFILKIFEQKRLYITFSGVNIQNLIILFWLNILVILQWFKWSIKRFYNIIYYWFFTDTNNILFDIFISEFFYLIKDTTKHF